MFPDLFRILLRKCSTVLGAAPKIAKEEGEGPIRRGGGVGGGCWARRVYDVASGGLNVFPITRWATFRLQKVKKQRER